MKRQNYHKFLLFSFFSLVLSQIQAQVTEVGIEVKNVKAIVLNLQAPYAQLTVDLPDQEDSTITGIQLSSETLFVFGKKK